MERIACLLPWLLFASAGLAQPSSPPPPENVLNLSASASVEVPQDQVTMRLSTTRQATQATAVQEQLKAAVETALAELKPLAQEGQMEVRTGTFNIHPRYDREGRIETWSGTAEIILEGRDIQRITKAAAQVDSMTVAGVDFGLSREQLRQAEARAQQMAIERFRSKADELSRGFGFSGYSLREATVQSIEQGPPPRPRMLAMEARSAASDSSIPVEAGKTTVQITVSGSVQMQSQPKP